MNKVNVQHCINIMQRAKNLHMPFWQGVDKGPILETEAELHACGTAACFAGHVAVSPEFIADGGSVCVVEGSPVLGGQDGHSAIARWLDIPDEEAATICCVWTTDWPDPYGKSIWDVTKEDVIRVLEELLNEQN